ncbi:unnamed protein product, partial [Musa acuminata subsp. burmannicoides]
IQTRKANKKKASRTTRHNPHINQSIHRSISGDEAKHDQVPRPPLGHHRLPQHPFPHKPRLLQHSLRPLVVHVHQRLHPLQPLHLLEHGSDRHLHRRRRVASAPVGGRQHVAQLPLAAVAADAQLHRQGADGPPAEAYGPEPRVGEHRLPHVPAEVLLVGVAVPPEEGGHPVVGRPHHVVVEVREVEPAQEIERRVISTERLPWFAGQGRS